MGRKHTARIVGPRIVVQPDWNQTDPEKADFIRNKPEIVTPISDECYFAINDDGLVSLKPEYRGLGLAGYSYSISDNGTDVAGSLNANLPENLVIPDVINEIAVTGFQPATFANNRRIKKLTIPGYIKEIPERFCQGTFNMEEINGTLNVETVQAAAFQGTGLKRVDFPNLKELIGVAHFANNPYLVIADIGNYLTALPTAFLGNCERLSTIVGGQNVNSVGVQSLFYTHRLKNLGFAENLTDIAAMGLYNSRVDYNWLTKNINYGAMSTWRQYNPTDWWSAASYTPCEIPLKSTFNQFNPKWYDGASPAGNCQVCAAAAIYSAFENREMETPEEFVEAVRAVDPALLNDVGSSEGIRRCLEAVGYTATLGSGGWNTTVLQEVYDALSRGALVLGGVLGSSGNGRVSHTVLFHGITDTGEIMVVDPHGLSMSIEKYEASTYKNHIQNMSPYDQGQPVIVEKR